MFKQISKAILLTSCLLAASSANAVSLTASNSYTLNGAWTVSFTNPTGSYLATLNLVGGTIATGTQSGNTINTFSLLSALNSTAVYKAVGNTWVQLLDGSAVTGNLNLQAAGIRVNGDGTVAAAIGGQATFPSITSNLSGNFEGKNFSSISSSFMPAFMDFTAGQFAGSYDAPINAFSSNGSLNYAATFFGNGLHSWLKAGSAIIDGKTFSLGGDIHAGVSQVPEPASLTLLGAGLLGGLAKRRKRKEQEATV